MLNLARTTSGFRKMLMTKTGVALTIWRKVITNVGLPLPPPFISEPYWVSFVFGKDNCDVRVPLHYIQSLCRPLTDLHYLQLQKCGQWGIWLLDFPTLKRWCRECRKQK